MLHSQTGMDRLLNLLSLIYALMLLLPYLDADFGHLQSCSPQQTRFLLGLQIQNQLFLILSCAMSKPSIFPLDSLTV